MLRSKKKISSLLSGVMFLSLLFPAGQAAAANPAATAPSVIDMRQMEIGRALHIHGRICKRAAASRRFTWWSLIHRKGIWSFSLA